MENGYRNYYFAGLATRALVIAFSFFFSATCSKTSNESYSTSEVEVAARAADLVSEARLMENIKLILDARDAEEPRELRSFSFPENFSIPYLGAATLAFVKKVWTELQYDFVVEEEQIFGMPVTNIYIDIAGTETLAPKVLVIAHYDSWGAGAVDNAAGVSAVLELSNLLKELKLRYGVRLLLTDHEETTMWGIQSYLKKHSIEDYRLVLNVDMLGYKSDAEPSIIPSSLSNFENYPKKGDFLFVLANETSAAWASRVSQLGAKISNLVPTMNVIVAKNGINDTSRELMINNADHSALWAKSISPTLFVTTGSSRYPHYHQSTDSLDKIDSGFLYRNGRLLAAIVAATAGAEQ